MVGANRCGDGACILIPEPRTRNELRRVPRPATLPATALLEADEGTAGDGWPNQGGTAYYTPLTITGQGRFCILTYWRKAL